MPFVLDACVVACWAFPDEDHPVADLALSRIQLDHGVVPSLFWFEIRNILLMGERRKRITSSDTSFFLQRLKTLRTNVDSASDDDQVLRLARSHHLTVYDATYLELAQRERLPLGTLDRELARAARAEGVVLLGE